MQWLADDTRIYNVLDSVAGFVIGLWIIRGVFRMGYFYMGDLLRRRDVVVHMA